MAVTKIKSFLWSQGSSIGSALRSDPIPSVHRSVWQLTAIAGTRTRVNDPILSH